MMNGIKEDIKTLLTLELGSPLFHEVVVNLSVRLKALQVQSLWYPINGLVVFICQLFIACETFLLQNIH